MTSIAQGSCVFDSPIHFVQGLTTAVGSNSETFGVLEAKFDTPSLEPLFLRPIWFQYFRLIVDFIVLL